MKSIYKPEGTLIDTARNRELISSIAGLEYALQHGLILEGIATLCDSKCNLHIDLGSYSGIIEREDVIYNKNGELIKDIAILTRVGKAVCFKIKSIDDIGGKKIIKLSRKEAQRDCYENFLLNLIPGDIINSTVTHLENFGAFVDIGCGVSSLLSIDCISVSRISHPKDRLMCGMNIMTVIKSIDYCTGRIYVSHRELLGTWEENASLFATGQTIAGIIRSVESYGIFVELTPNLAGLAELRESKVSSNNIFAGQRAAVYIKSIIPERMKIKLVLIDIGKGCVPPSMPEYFIDTTVIDHIDSWNYSPNNCSKIIQTLF